MKCVVSSCPNRVVNYNRGCFNRPPKRFFSFPKDPDRVKVWLAALRETDKADSAEEYLICEDHFLPEDISKHGVASDAIPLMPPHLDGSLISSWGADSTEEDEQWSTGGCDGDGDEDEGGEDTPAPPNLPQQDPSGSLENPPEAEKTSKTSAAWRLREESSTDSRPNMPLDLLTRHFMELLQASPDGSLDLQHLATSLHTPLQQVYNITNILDGISLIQKESANRIKWIGCSPISSFLWRTRQTFWRELKNLKQVERELDGLIKSCAQQLFDMTDDEKNSASAYVTREDISRLGGYKEQTVIVIHAPEETKLEIPAPKEESIQVHLKARKGPIMAMTCEVGSGDPVEKSSSFLTLEESRIRTATLDTEPSGPQSAVQTT
ncbi:transcription factor E2F6-like [Stegastes partitus]|uniref:Transcription factor E2F6-like n=1 Tax=Stegastes partitus TaxID=144197 RepID=A0A9Y4N9Y6_9TELE|nr:PREDICTED: transcription factor E2F6-like [Stegastes partitus]